MNVEYLNKNLIVTGLKDFNLKHIFDCGQCFRFNEISKNTYFGIAKNKAIKISQFGDTVTLYDTEKNDWDNIWFDFFDLSRDYGEIKQTLSPTVTEYGFLIRIYGRLLFPL